MGFKAKTVRAGDPVPSARWNEHERELERLGRVRTGPGVAARSGPGGLALALDIPELVWVKVTGPAGADAGYPYAREDHRPPLEVTSPGSGYTTATATVSGGGGSGAAVALDLDPSDGSVARARLTTPGTNYDGTQTVSVAGDGSGAAVAFNPPWLDSADSGDGVDDAAYDAGGSRAIPEGPDVYPAIRSPTSGRLVFFGGAGGGGVYAFLASGAVITGASGATLGSGTVTLCSRSGAALTADGGEATTYNAGGEVTGAYGSGTYVKLGVMGDGSYTLDVVLCS